MNIEKDIFFTRRSIRNYTDEKIEKGKIEYIINSGMHAPSAKNIKSWEFIVVDDKNIFTEINKIHPYSNMILECSHAIIVCGNLDIDKDGCWWIQNCAAATQNILLASESIGIGSCWLGVAPYEELMTKISDMFSMPSHIKPFCIITLGYSSKPPRIAKTRYEIEKIHYNKFGTKIDF